MRPSPMTKTAAKRPKGPAGRERHPSSGQLSELLLVVEAELLVEAFVSSIHALQTFNLLFQIRRELMEEWFTDSPIVQNKVLS